MRSCSTARTAFSGCSRRVRQDQAEGGLYPQLSARHPRERRAVHPRRRLGARRPFSPSGGRTSAYSSSTPSTPAARCADPVAAAVYGAEPYVLSADVYAARGNEGRAGWSWYTGARRVVLPRHTRGRARRALFGRLPPRNGGARRWNTRSNAPCRRKSSHCLRRRRRDDAQRTALHLPRHAGGGRKRNHRPARRLMQKNCNNALRRIDKKRTVCYNADIGGQTAG